MIRQLVCLGILFSLSNPRTAAAVDDLGLKVAPGFKVSLYADENVANDIYAMTLDARAGWWSPARVTSRSSRRTRRQGRQGHAVRRDKTGGMGLCFDGNDLYFCGDDWSRATATRAGKAAPGPPNIRPPDVHRTRRPCDAQGTGWLVVRHRRQ